MMCVLIFAIAFSLLSQSIVGYRPSYSGTYNHHSELSLVDLVRWWDHEMPDWAKSSEEIEQPDYLNFYYPNGPGIGFAHPEEDYNNRPRHYPSFPWESDSSRHRPRDEKNMRLQYNPTPIPFDRTTDNAKWLRSIFLEPTTKAPLNKNMSIFSKSTNPPHTLITRHIRQSAENGFFQLPNPSTNTNSLSSTIKDCIKTCPSTNEYNPVCGTDNVTYNNRGKLECARFCGVDVSFRRNSLCTIVLNEGSNLPPPPPVNTPIIVNTNSQSGNIVSCINNCRKRGEVDPVCGSDGKTYDSSRHLLCAQLCGSDVRIQQLSACSNNNNAGETTTKNNIQPNPLTNSLVLSKEGTTSNAVTAANNMNSDTNFGFAFNVGTETTTLSPYIRSCLRTCPTTSEHNPVCGSNRVVYSNPSRLTCVRICGLDVSSRPLSFCSTSPATPTPITIAISTEPMTTTTTTAAPINPFECAKTCRLPSEVKPVCGTNGVTYRNIAYLECIKMCGADVELKSNSSCQEGLTTKKSSPLIMTTPEPGRETTLQASQNGLNFTIPLDVLNSVFLNNSTDSTTESEIDDELIRINDK